MNYQEIIAELNKTGFQLHNSIKHRKVGTDKFKHQICFYDCKTKGGIGAEFTQGTADDATGMDTKGIMTKAGWTEDTFNEYLDMMRTIHPDYADMIKDATFERPVMVLSCEKVVPRFSCMCWFRMMWERPKLAHTILELHRSGKLMPIELGLVAAFVFVKLERPVHWYLGLADGWNGTPNKFIEQFYNDDARTCDQVDGHLGMVAYFEPVSVNFKADEDMADPKKAIAALDKLFWKGARPNGDGKKQKDNVEEQAA